MRRRLAFLLCLALLLSACAPRGDAEPERTLAVFAVELPGAMFRPGDATIVVVDPVAGSIVASIPAGRVEAFSDVSTAPGTPRVIVGTREGYSEVDLDTRKVSALASPAAGEIPLGADYLADGTAVVWGRTDPDGLAVRHLLGPTETSATVDWREYAKTRGLPALGPTRLMLMSADDAAAYFVSSDPVRGRGGPISTVWRADFREGVVRQDGPTAPWPRSFPSDPDARPEEAVSAWGIPVSGDTTGVAFVDLEGEEQASLTTVPMEGPIPRIVFEPGGRTFFAFENMWTPPEAKVRVTYRSMLTPEERVVASQTVPMAGGMRPLGVIGNAYAYAWVEPSAETTSMWSRAEYQLRLRDLPSGRDATVLSMPYTRRYRPQITYLGSYQLR